MILYPVLRTVHLYRVYPAPGTVLHCTRGINPRKDFYFGGSSYFMSRFFRKSRDAAAHTNTDASSSALPSPSLSYSTPLSSTNAGASARHSRNHSRRRSYTVQHKIMGKCHDGNIISAAIATAPSGLGLVSRPVAGTRGNTLVVTLPGSPRAAQQQLAALMPLLPRIHSLMN